MACVGMTYIVMAQATAVPTATPISAAPGATGTTKTPTRRIDNSKDDGLSAGATISIQMSTPMSMNTYMHMHVSI